jgi:hypothetical protein
MDTMKTMIKTIVMLTLMGLATARAGHSHCGAEQGRPSLDDSPFRGPAKCDDHRLLL